MNACSLLYLSKHSLSIRLSLPWVLGFRVSALASKKGSINVVRADGAAQPPQQMLKDECGEGNNRQEAYIYVRSISKRKKKAMFPHEEGWHSRDVSSQHSPWECPCRDVLFHRG